MPRPTQNKLYRTFTKGLITEAGFLTYPENASIDELNTVIKTKGSRSRRLGLDYEPSSAGSTISGMTDVDVTSEFAWKGVGNNSAINFVVVQVKGTIHFFDMDAIPIDSHKKSFTINLVDYKAPYATTDQVVGTPVQMAAGKGFLFLVSPFLEPISIEYNETGGVLIVEKIAIRLRDFDGVDDGLGNEDQPTTISHPHYYNLRNQGWVQPGPLGVVEGTPTLPYTGTPPDGSSSGTGGGGNWVNNKGEFKPNIP